MPSAVTKLILKVVSEKKTYKDKGTCTIRSNWVTLKGHKCHDYPKIGLA
jgi:hypothetical protein